MLERFKQMFEGCKTALSAYERRASTLSWVAFSIAIVGALTGSVLAPALTAAAPSANSVAIAALSGTSGAANVAQGALEKQGMTAEDILELRKETRKEFLDAVTMFREASKSHDTTDMAKAIDRGEIACLTYTTFDPKLTPKFTAQ